MRVRRANFNGNKVGPVDASDGGTNASIRGVVMAKMEMSSISTLRSSLEPKVNVPVSKESNGGGAVVLFGLHCRRGDDDGHAPPHRAVRPRRGTD